MTVSEGRRMHTKSLRHIINLLKGRPNINEENVRGLDLSIKRFVKKVET